MTRTAPTLSAAPPVQRASDVGDILRDWRARRRRSQMDLALDVGVSPRHLSFIETGRSRASAAVLEALADRLQVPLRERNRLLLAGGYAPRYTARPLADASMEAVRAALERLLQAHAPNPGLVLDRHWNVVLANAPAQGLMALLPEHLRQAPVNVFRVSLHPLGLAAWTVNFEDWARYLLRALDRACGLAADPALDALAREVQAYPNVQALLADDAAAPFKAEAAADAGLLLPCVLELPMGRLSMFTTLTTFGTPRDITLEELSVELFYPADAATEQVLRQLHGA